MPTPLPPEFELLILLSRQDLDDAALHRTRELITGAAGAVDWPHFTDQATQHKVGPLVHRSLVKVQQAGRLAELDITAFSLLQWAYLYFTERSVLLAAELGRILAAAAAASVPLLLRKGSHLAYQVYRDPGVRPMGDLDLLAEPEAAGRLSAVLRDLGYTEGNSEEDRGLTRREQIFWRMYGSDLPQLTLRTGSSYCPVYCADISVALTLPRTTTPIPLGPLLERSVGVQVGGQPARVMSPADTVFDLCLHLYKNSTVLRFMRRGKHRRLLKYVDIAECLRTAGDGFDWAQLTGLARQYDVAGPVLFSLTGVDRLFPGVVPPAVLDELRADYPRWEPLLDEYGQWELPEPRRLSGSFPHRFFDRATDAELPASKSMV
ncbi:MAG TPA: nucleotidyltransferase family protein [Streptosporangiaceae bacterium]